MVGRPSRRDGYGMFDGLERQRPRTHHGRPREVTRSGFRPVYATTTGGRLARRPAVSRRSVVVACASLWACHLSPGRGDVALQGSSVAPGQDGAERQRPRAGSGILKVTSSTRDAPLRGRQLRKLGRAVGPQPDLGVVGQQVIQPSKQELVPSLRIVRRLLRDEGLGLRL